MTEKVKQSCEFSSELVGYLYRDSEDAVVHSFERHLADCSACIDEFAALAHSRFEVYEWQRQEFAPLATPRFEVPYDATRIGALSGLRAIFALKWAVPAFAAVAVVIGIAFLASGPKMESVFVVSETTPVEVTESNPPQAAGLELKANEAISTAKPKHPGDEVVQVARPRRVERVVAPKSSRVNAAVAQLPAPTTSRAPTLSADVEAADRSLRLSDIFDSDGTR